MSQSASVTSWRPLCPDSVATHIIYRATKKSASAQSVIFRMPLTAEAAIITDSPMLMKRNMGGRHCA